MWSWVYQRVLPVILSNQGRRVYLISRFPWVVRVWIALPVDEVLEGSCTSMEAVINNVLDFIFRFSFYEVRGWSRVVRPVDGVLVIGGE
jgi:hypothetical protein